MKKWTKVFGIAFLVFAVGMLIGYRANAADAIHVTQTAATTNSITVKWDYSNGTQYECTLKDGNTSTIKTVNTTECLINNLSAGKTYLVSVKARKNGTYVGESKEIEVVTVPANGEFEVTQTAATDSTITLKATSVTGVNFYQVYQNNTLVGTSSSNTIKLTKLAKAKEYAFHIYAVRRSSVGFIAKGDDTYCYIYAKTLPSAYTKKTFGVAGSPIAEAIYGKNLYSFKVSGSSPATGYEWQFKDVNGNVKKTEKSTTPTLTLEKFVNGTFYQYRVRAYLTCVGGTSYTAWSPYRYIGTMSSVPYTATKKAVTINWSKISGASKYIVYGSKKEKSGFKKLTTTNAKKRRAVIKKIGGKALKKNTTYYIRIQPVAKIGNKAIKADDYVTTSIKTKNY